MPFPLLTAGTARSSAGIRLVSVAFEQQLRPILAPAPLQWNPHEVGYWPHDMPGVKLIKPAVLFDAQTPGGGGTGPAIPTTGQIWPRGNR